MDATSVEEPTGATPPRGASMDLERIAVVLRRLEDRGNPEIAAALDTSVEAVESLLARARRALAADLAGRRQELGYTDG